MGRIIHLGRLKWHGGVKELCINYCYSTVEKQEEKLSISMINALIISKIISMDRIYFSNHKEVFKQLASRCRGERTEISYIQLNRLFRISKEVTCLLMASGGARVE
ncbi:mCG148139 [Mus musculus]|jgi:hypothetical protein|nr:mCG148139 [Mus musculus]